MRRREWWDVQLSHKMEEIHRTQYQRDNLATTYLNWLSSLDKLREAEKRWLNGVTTTG